MDHNSDQKKIRMFVQEVVTLAQFGAFNVIDELLLKAINKLPESSPLKMITYAKSTSLYKLKLKNWNKFVQMVKVELDKRNIDSAKELIGLI